MTWDDELEELALKVHEASGDDALGKGYPRALTSAPAAAVGQIPETPLDIRRSGAGGNRARDVGRRRALSVTALKGELRRFLKPD
jgi:hypothetical protein